MVMIAWLLGAGGCVFDPNGVTLLPADASPPRTDAPPPPTIDARTRTPACLDAGADDTCRYTHRRKLTFLAAGVGVTLYDMPVLVTLDASRIDYAATQPKGADLRFIDADGQTLAYEIETWTPGGTSLVWVRAPRIDMGATSEFMWMYYGDPDASDAQDPHSVWSSSYEAVYHLGDTSVTDSSPHGRDATDHGTIIAPGKLGMARAFDPAASAFLDTGYNANLNQFTIEAWVKGDAPPSTTGNISAFVSRENNYQLNWDHFDPSYAGAATLRVGSSYPVASFGTITAGAWTWLCMTWDGATLRAYQNGQVSGTDTSANGNPSGDNTTAKIGRDGSDSNGGAYFSGAIDEVRIVSYPHSPAWMDAQYRSMTDTFLSYGADEAL